jgi:hypothetical protein
MKVYFLEGAHGIAEESTLVDYVYVTCQTNEYRKQKHKLSQYFLASLFTLDGMLLRKKLHTAVRFERSRSSVSAPRP